VSKTATERRRELKAKVISYLGGACRICGYAKCEAALCVHHPDPTAKEFTVSAHMTSWDRIVRELDKCVLLCNRCHSEVHENMWPHYLDPDGAWASHDDAYSGYFEVYGKLAADD
jgi:hypothetical protein